MLPEILTYRCPTRFVALVSAEEIKSALHALPNDKVSGPDGFTKEFYISAWSIIGKEFIIAVKSFFLFGFLPTGTSTTILTLIPKMEEAQSMNDYRLIACWNLLYKVISKVFARLLKTILPDAIKPNQTAFIKGRLLLKNVLLALELVNEYQRTSNSNRATVKFDISKAFDIVKWSFITSFLKAKGLPAQFLLWTKSAYLLHRSLSTSMVAWKAF